MQKIIAEHLKMPLEEATKYKLPSGCTFRPRIMTDRPIYGLPLREGPLTFAPTNEAGVLAAFACYARELGFTILRLQAAFPDCEALREVGPNKGQRVLIELEYESRNFLDHMHPITGCDLIVCWINNWPDCPLEVIELSSVLRAFAENIGMNQRTRSPVNRMTKAKPLPQRTLIGTIARKKREVSGLISDTEWRQ